MEAPEKPEDAITKDLPVDWIEDNPKPAKSTSALWEALADATQINIPAVKLTELPLMESWPYVI